MYMYCNLAIVNYWAFSLNTSHSNSYNSKFCQLIEPLIVMMIVGFILIQFRIWLTVFNHLVSLSLQDLGLQPEDSFILKIVQLEELRHVRHSIFVIGNAGTGKSKVCIRCTVCVYYW